MHKGQILELEVTDLAFGGRGIAKINLEEKPNFTIFIDGALPGQTVEAKIAKKKRRYAEAKLIKVIKRSKSEIKTDYQTVPGAPWAKLPIETQHQYKQQQVFELFKKFADLDITPLFDEYVASPQPWHYRNKMEYSFGPTEEAFEPGLDELEPGLWSHTGFGLGSKKRGQFWLVESLEKDSGLFDQNFENLLPIIRDWCQSVEPTAYNSRKNEGFWRSLMVRKSVSEDKFLVNMITNLNATETMQQDLVTLLEEHLGDRIKGVYWTQSDDLGNPATKYKQRDLIYGEPDLVEKLNGLNFKISIDSFFQTNVYSAAKLYDKTISYLNSEATQVFDLFCGTGTIGQLVAHQRPDTQITGVEIIESAVRDAQSNADKNGIKNAKFITADINKWIKANTPGAGTTIILDPPRAGISPKVLTKIAEAGPAQIVYVSCNPATMARDIELLQNNNFSLKHISLVDQFPHTSHVECIGSLFKR